MTLEEREKWIKEHRIFLENKIRMELIGIPHLKGKTLVVEITAKNGESYTATIKDRVIVHIGLRNVSADNEDELAKAALFLIGHECEHVRCTTDKAWRYGLDRGVKEIIEHMARKEHYVKYFRTDADYEEFLREQYKKYGVTITIDALGKLVHFIQNSLEDGRIERIRMARLPGFKHYVILNRGKEWAENTLEKSGLKNWTDPREYLYLILNQILTLSTMRICQKGYGEIPLKEPEIHKKVLSAIPAIKKAVLSPNCRGCMYAGVELCDLLAEDIWEASKATPLEELIQQLMQQLKQEFSENERYCAETSTEETDSTDISLFGTNLFDQLETDEENGNNPKENAENGKGSNSSDSKEDTVPSMFSDTEIEDELEQDMEEAEDIVKPAVERLNSPSAMEEETVEKKPVKSTVNEIPNLDAVANAYEHRVHFEELTNVFCLNRTLPPELGSRAEWLKQQIKRLLQNKQKPNLRRRRSGSIYAPDLYRLVQKEIDIFNRKETVAEFDGCVYILQDNSGSMLGEKRTFCSEAVSCMEHAFENLMPLKIVAFDAKGDSYCRHIRIKDWNEHSGKNATYNFLENYTAGYGNKDGYSIRVSTKELLARSEKKKILIVLSDGLPSDYRGGYTEGAKDVKAAVQEARRKGIEVIPIYFGEEIDESLSEIKMFRSMYEQNCIVTEPSKIEIELIVIMTRILLQNL